MATLTRRQLAGLILLTVMWGLTWPANKVGLSELAPLHYRAVTMGAGAVLLGLYFRSRSIPMLPRGKDQWRSVIVLGLPNVLGMFGFTIVGLAQLPAGRSTTLFYTMPVWTVLLSVLFYHERFSARLAFAIAAVLIGITLLLWDELAMLTGQPAGIAWLQAGALSWAIGTIWTRRARITLPAETLVVWMMLLSAPVLGLLGILLEPPQIWHFSTPVWASIIWSALINHGVAQVIWFGLTRAVPPSTISMGIMAVPLVGLLGAMIMIGEQPSWHDYAAVLCIMSAIGAVLLRRQ